MVYALESLGIKDYKDLMSEVICDINFRNCMIHQCDACPGVKGLSDFLALLFLEAGMDDEDTINFKRWEQADYGVSIVSRSEMVAVLIEELCRQVELITSHYFIAKSQAEFLTASKTTLKENSAVILLDFAENYSFLVQDAIQGHHWNNRQATLHPFTVYYMKDNTLKTLSICVISDCMQHDSITVHVFLRAVLSFISETMPNIEHVMYFSDGAASQYKNFKNFCNLLHHPQDFNLTAEGHFFATSHGKSPCDGIGGTVKRLAAGASLQAITTNHILTPQKLSVGPNDLNSSLFPKLTFLRQQMAKKNDFQQLRRLQVQEAITVSCHLLANN